VNCPFKTIRNIQPWPKVLAATYIYCFAKFAASVVVLIQIVSRLFCRVISCILLIA